MMQAGQPLIAPHAPLPPLTPPLLLTIHAVYAEPLPQERSHT